ncbi:MAG: hypothetical protein K1X88_33450, partial [Nannocystaceae bacterium]|nr:hypothetical protein [Nannocystaceae bacterium]
MGQHELYDVVIVGARVAGPRGLEALTRAVVDRFAMPQASVQAGLAQGALEIHRKLSKLEAIAAARSLHEIGAIVDVRPSRGESGALVLEPDEQGHAVTLPPAPPFSGGGGDDRDLLTVSRLDSADDLEVPPVRRGTPAAVERGRPASTDSDRGAAAMLRAAASNRPRTQPPRPVEPRAPEPLRTREATRSAE